MAATPLPMRAVMTIFVVLFANSLIMTMPFPFLPFMVRDHGIKEEEVGDYVGLVASGLFLGRALTAYWPWGVWSDTYGRRPVILWSVFLIGVCTIAFGFNQSLWFAVLTRFATGLTNGAVPAAKTMLSEVCDETNQGLGMSLITASWGCGLVMGPVIGGFLSTPATKYHIFGHSSLLISFPYLLPCLVSSAFCFMATLFSYLYLRETLPSKAARLSDDKDEADSREKLIGSVTAAAAVPSAQEATPGCLSSMTRLLREFEVRISVIIYCILSFAVIAFDEIFPLFTSTSLTHGGLGWNTNDIGMSMAICGALMIPLQMVSYRAMETRMNLIQLFQLNCFIMAVTGALVPLSNLLQATQTAPERLVVVSANNTDPKQATVTSHQTSPTSLWLYIIVTLLVYRITAGNAFVANALFLNNSVAASRRGQLNGLAMMLTAVSRAIAPTFAGTIFAWSISGRHSFPFGHHLIFIITSAILVLVVFWARQLPASIMKQK